MREDNGEGVKSNKRYVESRSQPVSQVAGSQVTASEDKNHS